MNTTNDCFPRSHSKSFDNSIHFQYTKNRVLLYSFNQKFFSHFPCATKRQYNKGIKIDLSEIDKETISQLKETIKVEVGKRKCELDEMQYRLEIIKSVGMGEEHALQLTMQGVIMLSGLFEKSKKGK
eukprot:TRINITY_DN16485_c0_g1_i1.p1 TRINITY_DN16485_c0_g1~~TRINITY_DN16485_c0_g1_i1.p1  ORF type:complete len:141 (-),score=37.60 TRINITY_DN16485_c0_g1_i1:97-477(-)